MLVAKYVETSAQHKPSLLIGSHGEPLHDMEMVCSIMEHNRLARLEAVKMTKLMDGVASQLA